MSKISNLTAGAPALWNDELPVARSGGNRKLDLGQAGVPFIVGKSAIPFIHLSSGSVNAAGAITGITALPVAYAHAYCFFPANILATTIAAGWHYCTFSTTTAGTAFLDTYTVGVPTIPATPVAVTDGKGAFTGDTTERLAFNVSIPAGAMGANGSLRFRGDCSNNNSAGAKTFRFRFNGVGGTVYGSQANTTAIGTLIDGRLANRALTNSQVGHSFSITTAGGVGGATQAVVSTVDTAAAVTAGFTIIKATATDNAILEEAQYELLSDGT